MNFLHVVNVTACALEPNKSLNTDIKHLLWFQLFMTMHGEKTGESTFKTVGAAPLKIHLWGPARWH